MPISDLPIMVKHSFCFGFLVLRWPGLLYSPLLPIQRPPMVWLRHNCGPAECLAVGITVAQKKISSSSLTDCGLEPREEKSKRRKKSMAKAGGRLVSTTFAHAFEMCKVPTPKPRWCRCRDESPDRTFLFPGRSFNFTACSRLVIPNTQVGRRGTMEVGRQGQAGSAGS